MAGAAPGPSRCPGAAGPRGRSPPRLGRGGWGRAQASLEVFVLKIHADKNASLHYFIKGFKTRCLNPESSMKRASARQRSGSRGGVTHAAGGACRGPGDAPLPPGAARGSPASPEQQEVSGAPRFAPGAEPAGCSRGGLETPAVPWGTGAASSQPGGPPAAERAPRLAFGWFIVHLQS